MHRKNIATFVAVGATLLLAGCGQEHVYTAHYYETHKAALKKELEKCKKAESLSGHAEQNCKTAEQVKTGETMRNLTDSPITPSPPLTGNPMDAFNPPKSQKESQ